MTQNGDFTFVWIRHGEKAYRNSKGPDDSPQHDSPLLEGVDDIIREKGENLALTYGNPEMCVSSPFERTRKTTQHLCESFEYPPPHLIDSRVSEYSRYL